MRRRSFTRRSVRFPGREGRGEQRVYAFGDGVPLSPEEYSQLLARSTAGADSAADDYSRGAWSKKLEARMAAMLGKEAAVWLPTGTLANILRCDCSPGSKRPGAGPGRKHHITIVAIAVRRSAGSLLVPLAPGRRPSHWSKPSRLATFPMLGRVETPHRSSADRDPVRRRAGNASTRRNEKAHGLGARAPHRHASGRRAIIFSKAPTPGDRPRVRRRCSTPSTFRCTSISTRQRCDPSGS